VVRQVLVLVTMIFLAAGVLLAQGKPDARGRPQKNSGMAVTPEREAVVYTFVERHHPELADLLRHLKDNNETKQYERAIRELYAVSERLSRSKDNDEERYELELKAWKVKSRIQLLSAKLTMGDNADLKKELKASLAEQHGVRRQIMQLERGRLRESIKKIDKDLADHDARREAAIEKQFQALTSAGASARPRPDPARSKPEKRAKDGAKGTVSP